MDSNRLVMLVALSATWGIHCSGGSGPTDTGTDATGGDVVVNEAAADVSPADAAADVAMTTDAASDAQVPDGWDTPPTVPDAIALPDGGTLLLHASAQGTQNYTCETVVMDGGTGDGGSADAGTSYVWTFTGPMATLYDSSGAMIGMHFSTPGGPTWQTTDGTSVTAMKTGMAASPDPNSIPWLILHAVAHNGTGTLSQVQYIQRVNTSGGKAPATGCDATTVGTTSDVNYTADYYFFGM